MGKEGGQMHWQAGSGFGLSELARLDPSPATPEPAGTTAPGSLASCPQYKVPKSPGGGGWGHPIFLCLEQAIPTSGPWHWLLPQLGKLFPPPIIYLNTTFLVRSLLTALQHFLAFFSSLIFSRTYQCYMLLICLVCLPH